MNQQVCHRIFRPINKCAIIARKSSKLTSLSTGYDFKSGVYLVATPIGNMGDISDRSKELLRLADVIFAEDTRHTAILLRHLNIFTPQLSSYHDHNCREKIPKILHLASLGNTIAVVSDAGTPGISDPGAELAAACAAHSVPLYSIPGPSALTAALSVSGFKATPSTFMGFIPSKGRPRSQSLTHLSSTTHTVVFFESPHRMLRTMSELSDVYGQGNRMCVCCRELTKRHEEIWRGIVYDSVSWLQTPMVSDSDTIPEGSHADNTDVYQSSSAVNNDGLNNMQYEGTYEYEQNDSDDSQEGLKSTAGDIGNREYTTGSSGSEVVKSHRQDETSNYTSQRALRTNAVATSGRVRGEFTIVLAPWDSNSVFECRDEHNNGGSNSGNNSGDGDGDRLCQDYLKEMRNDGVSRSEAVRLVTDILTREAPAADSSNGRISPNRRDRKMTKSDVYKIALGMPWK